MSTTTDHDTRTRRLSRGPDLDPIAARLDRSGERTSPRERSTRSIGAWARRALGAPWDDWRAGIGAAIGAGALWGAIAGWWTPRGPLTTAEALWSIAISLLVGALAGVVTRSRWPMLATPLAFAAVFELTRIGTDGPTVDAIRTSTYGVIALIVGRGFHALLTVFPMLLGTAVGAGIARNIDRRAVSAGSTAGRYARRGVAALTAIGLIMLAAGLARPASTDPIVDADGNEIPGSIAELTTVDINGHDLGMMIRGRNTDNPVLLFLAGGPGGSELGAMRRHLPELEQHFTVVTWDQRGTGRSYPELDPIDTITLDGAVDDTIAVTKYLRARFDQNEIYLLGQSWGTILGVLAVREEPAMYRAFVGTGQMVSPLETDRIFYDDTLAWARANGDDDLVGTLIDNGPPPYDDMLDYETALGNEHEVYRYDHSPNAEGAGQMSENLLVSEYTLLEQVHILAGFMETFAVLYPQLQDIDFRETATDFDVPVFFVQGANEAHGRARPFDEWYPMVDAPTKDLAVLDTSGHRPLWEQPDEFVDYMVTTVLDRTQRS